MKFKTMVDGKEIEVELSEEQITDSVSKDSGILQKLKALFKISDDTSKKDEQVKKEETPKKEEKKVESNQEVTALRQEVEALKKQREEEQKARTERIAKSKEIKVRKLIDEAITDGKIAKGETEALVKKYKESPEFLKDYLLARPADTNLKKQNTTEVGADGKPVGTKVFSQSEIEKMTTSEYKANRKDILDAWQKKTIIE